MAFSIHEQYVDLSSGMHVVELRDGKKQVLTQIRVGAEECAACGHLTPKTNLGELDPKARIAEEIEALNKSHADMQAYAKKHGVSVR